MTSVIVSNVLPDIITPVSVSYSNTIQSAYSLRFYYKGGKDVICIQRSSKDVFTVYIPMFSLVERGNIVATVISMEKDIEREETTLAIPVGKFFLFDTGTKKVLDINSFIDFLPFINTKNTIFIVQNENGTIEPTILYLADQTNYGILQFLPLVIAKRELIMSKKACGWGIAGRKLLTYLVVKRYGKECNFSSEMGCWDTMRYDFNVEQDHHPAVNLDKLILERANGLAAGINYTTYLGYMDGTLVKEGEQVILLSDILQSGVKSFCNDKYSQVIEVEIDVLKETYKSVNIYTQSGVVFVELNQGIELTEDRIKEDLDANEVTLVNDIQDISEANYGKYLSHPYS